MADRLAMKEAASMTGAGPSRLILLCDRGRVRRWHVWLASALEATGRYAAHFSFVEGDPLPSSVDLLMTLERLVYGRGGERASDVLDETERGNLPRADGGPYDLAIDFTGRGECKEAARTLRPTFEGIAGEAGAIGALLERRLPRLGLTGSDGTITDFGASAVEDPALLSRGLDNAFSRMGGLLLAALRQAGESDNGAMLPPRSRSATAASRGRGAAPAAFFAASLAGKALARLSALLGLAPRWSIAWRKDASAPSAETLNIPLETFTRLPDDGRRFYADPFVLMRDGVAHVFCEEVPFATNKGVISHFTLDADGNVSTPRPVLDRPYHLSYPFVFEREGEVWMIPESSANRTVELYRAERFPDRWVKHATLLENVLADDATLLEKDGRLWLLASVRDWQASSWDALGLFYADSLTGPWAAHRANPVLLDPAAARPAGAVFRRDGQLIRPAQDCAGGYGRGLAFCRIDRLDEEGFAQSVLARVEPLTGRVQGLHTYNRAGRFEVIDLFGRAR